MVLPTTVTIIPYVNALRYMGNSVNILLDMMASIALKIRFYLDIVYTSSHDEVCINDIVRKTL